MKLGYADPPYINCAFRYRNQPDYGGEVDHGELLERLESEFDGWVLHAAATAKSMAVLGPLVEKTGARWLAWVKPFTAYQRSVNIAYAWEPVILKPARKATFTGDKRRTIYRDWCAESVRLRRGFVGAKPEAVCHWIFELLGAEPDDELVDLYPGSGAVSRAWETWQGRVWLSQSLFAEQEALDIEAPVEPGPQSGRVAG
jgi:hypothetical protein